MFIHYNLVNHIQTRMLQSNYRGIFFMSLHTIQGALYIKYT